MNRYLMLFAFATIFLLTSCDPDEPMIDNEEELITTLNYSLTSSNGDVIILSFVDPDGDGGNAPLITGGTLDANETYTGQLQLLNESVSPSESITEEIEEEDDEHQFFFDSDIAGLSVSYNDQDGDGNPLGLRNTVTTGAAGSGTLTVTLRHEPNKTAEGVADGDITNAGGETDIEVSFPIDVQ